MQNEPTGDDFERALDIVRSADPAEVRKAIEELQARLGSTGVRHERTATDSVGMSDSVSAVVNPPTVVATATVPTPSIGGDAVRVAASSVFGVTADLEPPSGLAEDVWWAIRVLIAVFGALLVMKVNATEEAGEVLKANLTLIYYVILTYVARD